MKKLYRFGIVFFILLSSFQLLAQTGTVRGFVYDEASGEPIIFTNVFIENSTQGAATDINGYFVLTKVPVGKHTLRITYIGYDTLRKEIEIRRPNDVITEKLYLEEATFALEGVLISAEREEAKTETRTSVMKVSPKQISKLPSVGGQPDLAQYLQVVPGVVFTGDQGGQLYIRGGSPVQNKVLLDGMTIYNPFHSIGLYSIFETDIIRNADVYTGGYNAEYGGRVSSVMDVRTREGNKKNFSGKVSASTLGANVLLEGPIVKAKNDGASTSFIIAAKNSYLKESSQMLYNYIDEDGLPFNFTDIYGKLTLADKNGTRFNVFGFNFNDKVENYQALDNFQWTSYGGGANLIFVPGLSPSLMEITIAGSKYESQMDNETMAAPKISSVSGFDASFKMTYFIGNHAVKAGAVLSMGSTDYSFTTATNNDVSRSDDMTDFAAFAKAKIVAGRFIIEPGLRLQYYNSIAYFSPEPRLSMKFNITDRFRFKMATGIYAQNLSDVRSERDIVNLFTGFVSSVSSIPDTYQGETISHSVQKAEHLIAGFEIDMFKITTLNIEGYYKNFSLLTSLNRNKLYADRNDAPFDNVPGILYYDFVYEKGKAYGVDVSIKYAPGRFYLWGVYSLGYVTREDEYQEVYYPHFDRRHNVNIVSSYTAGSKKDWEFSLRWNLGSGFPYTLVGGYLGTLPLSGGLTTDYTTANETMEIIYADYNEARLPYYHRLDFNMKKTFKFGKRSTLETDISVTNVYDRDNIFYVNRITGEKVYQLPIMPSFGLTYRF
jgi:hypothetical protein